jgi:hypothetical protein
MPSGSSMTWAMRHFRFPLSFMPPPSGNMSPLIFPTGHLLSFGLSSRSSSIWSPPSEFAPFDSSLLPGYSRNPTNFVILTLMTFSHYSQCQKRHAWSSLTGSPPLALEGHRYLSSPPLSWWSLPTYLWRALVPRGYHLSIMTVDHCINCVSIRTDCGSIVDKSELCEVLHYPHGCLPWPEFKGIFFKCTVTLKDAGLLRSGSPSNLSTIMPYLKVQSWLSFTISHGDNSLGMLISLHVLVLLKVSLLFEFHNGVLGTVKPD